MNIFGGNHSQALASLKPQMENTMLVLNSITSQNIGQENVTNLNTVSYSGIFELPLNGTTGFASVSLSVFPSKEATKASSTIPAGTAFCIQKEEGEYFKIILDNEVTGWVESKYCLVNLPDILPSILYEDTNSDASIFRSSGYDLENITGKKLYNAKKENPRLGKEEYLMPVLYPMAKKIAYVQQDALKQGDTLKIYETYRPYEVQMKVSDSLTKLMESNETVAAGINTKPWSKSWFIATQLSNHQRGIAMDVSLAKVQETQTKQCGKYQYSIVSKHTEYKMPTKMHELSKDAATFASPVNSKSKTDWKKAKLAPSMTEGAKKLQNYCTSHNLHPLASEWWHFNDLDAREETKAHGSNGRYYLKECRSIEPNDYSFNW